MSIASEITRLQGVKSNILNAIADKGVTVPANSALADCPNLINSISAGGDILLPHAYNRLEYIHQSGNEDTAGYYQIDLGEGLTNEGLTFGATVKKDFANYQNENSSCMFFHIKSDTTISSSYNGVFWHNTQNYTNSAYSTVCNGGNTGGYESDTSAVNYPTAIATNPVTVEITGLTAWNRRTDGDKSYTMNSSKYAIISIRYLRLFGTFLKSGSGSQTPDNLHAMRGRIYCMYIHDGTTTLHYFVPAKRVSDSVIGFYDIVTGVFHEPLGTVANLTAGPTIPQSSAYEKNIISAINSKGVTVPSTAEYKDFAGYINQIEAAVDTDIVLPRTYTRIEYIHQSGDDGITNNSTGYYQIDLGNDFTNENKKFGIIAKRDSEAYQSGASNCLLFQISYRDYYQIEGITAQLWNPYGNVDTITWYNGGNQRREDAITHDGTPKITKVEISGTNCYIKSSIYSHEFTDGYYTKISTTTSNHYYLRLFGTFICPMGVNPNPARNLSTLKGNIYAMYINDGNNTIHYYIPCRRNSDSVIGFYDVIAGVFYEPLGNTSALTAGPDLQTLETSRVNTITAINSKGVTVPSTAEFTDFAGYINQILISGSLPLNFESHMYAEVTASQNTSISYQNLWDNTIILPKDGSLEALIYCPPQPASTSDWIDLTYFRIGNNSTRIYNYGAYGTLQLEVMGLRVNVNATDGECLLIKVLNTGDVYVNGSLLGSVVRSSDVVINNNFMSQSSGPSGVVGAKLFYIRTYDNNENMLNDICFGMYNNASYSADARTGKYIPWGNNTIQYYKLGSTLQELDPARQDIITAINDKSVTVPTNADFDDLAGYISQIPSGGGDIPAGYELLESMVFKHTDSSYWDLSAITGLNSTDKYSLGMFLNHSSQGGTTEMEALELQKQSGTNGGIYILLSFIGTDYGGGYTRLTAARYLYSGGIELNIPDGAFNVDFLTAGEVDVNGQTYTMTDAAFSNAYIRGFLRSTSNPGMSAGSQFYFLKIFTQDGVLKHNIVPLINTSTKKCMVCDIVTGTMSSTQNNNWVPGPIVR